MFRFPPARPYQDRALSNLHELFSTHDAAVLAACPGAGKTYMALRLAAEILAQGGVVLVLAHGTLVIKEQWIGKVREYFGIEPDGALPDGLMIALPQAKREIRKELKNRKVDLLIVDESHEFYHGEKLVQNIIKVLKPRHELLLTGTPARFVADGRFPIEVVSGCEVYREGEDTGKPNLTDLHFGLVTSGYLTDGQTDYNEDGDLKDTYQTTREATSVTLDAFLKEAITRLKTNSSGTLGNLKSLTRANKFLKVFNTLDKTMIATRSIAQAQDVAAILSGMGVTVVLSDSESDPDNLKIEEFKQDATARVLVVVQRGILGFDYPELCNVVNLTCSRNINRIYQLYARVLRVHPDGREKIYFHVTSSSQAALDSYYLQAALCLNARDFVTRFNGRNLSSLEIPVPKSKGIGGEAGTGCGGEIKKDTVVAGVPQGLMASEVLGLDLLSRVMIRSGNAACDEIEYARFGWVVTKLTGWRECRPLDVAFEEAKAWAIANGRRPSQHNKDPEEGKHGQWLSKQRNNPEVREWFDEHYPPDRRPLTQAFEEAKAWADSNVRRPSTHSKDPEEKKHGQWLTNQRNNPEVREWFDERYPPAIRSFTQAFEEAKAWADSNGRRPSQSSKDPEEKKHGKWRASQRNNPEVREWFDARYPSPYRSFDVAFAEAKEWAIANGRRPSNHSKDPEEKKHGQWLNTQRNNLEVRGWFDTRYPSTFRSSSDWLAAGKSFFATHHRLPSYSKSAPPEERRLATYLGQAAHRSPEVREWLDSIRNKLIA